MARNESFYTPDTGNGNAGQDAKSDWTPNLLVMAESEFRAIVQAVAAERREERVKFETPSAA